MKQVKRLKNLYLREAYAIVPAKRMKEKVEACAMLKVEIENVKAAKVRALVGTINARQE